MTEKRFSIKDGSSIGLSSIYTDNGKVMTQLEVLDVLIKQHETIQTLAKENEQLKQTISKIDFAIIRKYDNSLENLLDEIYDGEYNNWIQRQLLRAKKLEKGDVE